MHDFPLVDGHLDLAENVTLFGRDLTLSVAELRALEKRTTTQATVSLPELERGGIAVAMCTVTPGFLAQDVPDPRRLPPSAIYETQEEAEAQAMIQIELYETWHREGRVRLIKSGADLDHHLALWEGDGKPGIILLMESADPVVRISDLPRWWSRGLRMVGLTFGDTRYGAGVLGGSRTFKSGGLTSDGLILLEEMAELGFVWDVSHLAEDGVWQGLDLGFPRVCASHANARAFTPTDRHLSDDVIRAIAERDGVIGLVLYNGFLEPSWKQDGSVTVTLDRDLRRHAEHVASVASWHNVGIGSDLDGGFGREESPAEIDTVADLDEIGAVVPPEYRQAVLGENWLAFLRMSLPRVS